MGGGGLTAGSLLLWESQDSGCVVGEEYSPCWPTQQSGGAALSHRRTLEQMTWRGLSYWRRDGRRRRH